MIKKLKTMILTGIFSLATFGAPLIPAAVVVAQSNTQGGLCSGSQLDLNASCTVDKAKATDTVDSLVKTAINIFSWIIGIISVIMIMVGGVKYITSQGSSDSVTGAKNTILYAVVGLIIVALAQLIVRFVLGTAKGIDG